MALWSNASLNGRIAKVLMHQKQATRMKRENILAMFLWAILFTLSSSLVIPLRDPPRDGSGDPPVAGSGKCHCSLEGQPCARGPTGTDQRQHLLSTVLWSEPCIDDCSVSLSCDDRKDEGRRKRSDDHHDHFAGPPSNVYISPHPSSKIIDLDHESFDQPEVSGSPEASKTLSSIVNGPSEIEYASMVAIVVNFESSKEMHMATKLLSAIYATMLAHVRIAEVFDWKTFGPQGDLSPAYNEMKNESCVDDCSVSPSDDRKDEGRRKRSDDHHDHFTEPPSNVYISPHPSSMTIHLGNKDFDYKNSEELIYSSWSDLEKTSNDNNQPEVSRPLETKTLSSIVKRSSSEMEYTSILAIVVNFESPKEMHMAISAIYATMLAHIRVAEVFDWKMSEPQGAGGLSPPYKEINVTNKGSCMTNLKGTYSDTSETLTERTIVAMVSSHVVTDETTVTPPCTPSAGKESKAISSGSHKKPYEEGNVSYDAISPNDGLPKKVNLEVDGEIKVTDYKVPHIALDSTPSSASTTPTLMRLSEAQNIGIPFGTVLNKTTESVPEVTPHIISPSEVKQQNSPPRTYVSTSPEPDRLRNVMCSSPPKQNPHPPPLIYLLKFKSQKNRAFGCPNILQPESPQPAGPQIPPLPTAPQPQSSTDSARQKSSTSSFRLRDLLKPMVNYRGPYKGSSTQKIQHTLITDQSRLATASASGDNYVISSFEDNAPVLTASLAISAGDDNPSVASEDQSPSKSYVSTNEPEDDERNAFLEKRDPEDAVAVGKYAENVLKESGRVFVIESTDLNPNTVKSTSARINTIDSTNTIIDVDINSAPHGIKDKTGSEDTKDTTSTAAKNEGWSQSIFFWLFG